MSKEHNKLVIDRADPNSPYYVEKEEFEHVAVPGMKHGCKRRDGIRLPNFVVNLSLVKNMQLRHDDVFVIGFMKTGRKNSSQQKVYLQTLHLVCWNC